MKTLSCVTDTPVPQVIEARRTIRTTSSTVPDDHQNSSDACLPQVIEATLTHRIQLIRYHNPATSHHITANKLHPTPAPPISTLPQPDTICRALHHSQLVRVILGIFVAFWTFLDTERASAELVGGSIFKIWAVGEVFVFPAGCSDGHPVAVTSQTADTTSSTHGRDVVLVAQVVLINRDYG